MVLLAHKFKKKFRKKGPPIRSRKSFRKSLDRGKEKEKDKDERKKKSNVCYGCNRLGHLRIECPLEKKILKKGRKHYWLHWTTVIAPHPRKKRKKK